ncbi:class I SAM-dependent methyltransferase [bacterium]|nr:class I SAM-dependent methyltransferase [candidate division CSSED10-310 bacterium]
MGEVTIQGPGQSAGEPPWQLKLFHKSIKKKEKLLLLESLLPDTTGMRILDLGCSRGTLSYLLRARGGDWVHADLDLVNLNEAMALLGTNVVRLGQTLPFKDSAFDCVVSLDYIEHLEDDSACLDELHRVLAPGGLLILSTPITGRPFLLNRLKNVLGMTPDVYGHKREGYTIAELDQRLRAARFTVERRSTYARFFTELVELAINVAFTKIMSRRRRSGPARQARDGHISPGSGRELQSHAKAFKLYSLIYPFTWSVSRLDKVIPFVKGYATILVARKQAGDLAGSQPAPEA